MTRKMMAVLGWMLFAVQDPCQNPARRINVKKLFIALAALALSLACMSSARAQGPDAFTLDLSYGTLAATAQTSRYHPKLLPTDFSPAPCTSNNPYCGIETYWPEPCPQGLSCDPHGTIQLTAQATVSGIDIPWYLGFPNGGFLLQDCTLTYGSIQFNPRSDGTMSDGSKVGDTWYFIATTGTACTGYASGVTFSVTTNWTTTLVKPYCGRGGCATNYSYQLTGGSGVAQGPNQ